MIGKNTLIKCGHKEEGECCFRRYGQCTILDDCDFGGEECHFRKEDKAGPNLYDEGRKACRGETENRTD